MDPDLRFLLGVAGAAVFGSEIPPKPADADWQRIYQISKKHNISNIVYYGILKGNYDIPEPFSGMFKQDMFANLMISENQSREIKLLTGEFEKSGIDFLCLKGTVLRELYPSPDMRRMADADILIRINQYPQADEAMKKLGYEFIGESDHEYIYHKKPVMHVELHKYLIPSYNDDMYSYYGSGWDIAEKKDGTEHEYELKPDDNFVYLMTHLAKHYRDGGIGIKSVIDLKLYNDKNSLDGDYIKKQLIKLNIDKFADNVSDLLGVWFEGKKDTDLTDAMTDYILNSGEYGDKQNKEGAAAIRQFENEKDFSSVRKKKMLNYFFPPLENMKKLFPVLERAVWLLPFMWIIRWIRAPFSSKSRQNYKNISGSVTSDKMKKYYEHIEAVGLDIYKGKNT